jgi:putative DNA primase/helicase
VLADLDPKDDEAPEAAKARYLDQLDAFQPEASALIDSGNGIQVLWKLRDRIALGELLTAEDGEPELSEADLAKIADAEGRIEEAMLSLGSIAGTQNVDRILRLPGTPNLPNERKRRRGLGVSMSKVIRLNGSTCSLEEFPATEQRRQQGSTHQRSSNSDLPPMLESLLSIVGNGAYPSRSELLFAFITAAMRAGVGDAAIVDACLDANHGGCGIFEHCQENGDQDYVERQIQRARERTTSDLVLDPKHPIHTARELVARRFITDGKRILHRHRGSFWSWTGSYYSLDDDEVIASIIWEFLEVARQLVKVGQLAPFKPNRARVGDVAAALAAVCQLDSSIEPPSWLVPGSIPPAKEFLACGNGLLHLPTGTLHPPSSSYFNLSASEVIFDPAAPQPVQWLAFLKQLFEADQQQIDLLQDYFGYVISPDTSQQKILLMIGPKRSGKGTIGRILSRLLGRDSVTGPTMSSLAEMFGLEPLITKPLAIVSDARVGARTDKSAITERLLSISGEDTMTVHRKFKIAWHGRLTTRFMILTNELPSLTDGSGALAGRFIVSVLTKSFFGKEDPALTEKLATELPGILNWSIKGYRNLRHRGHFVQPQSSQDAIEEIEMLAAPVKAFIRDLCNVGLNKTVKVDELWGAWKNWCQWEGRRDAGTKAWFGRNLRSALPGLTVTTPGTRDNRVPTYVGIELKPSSSNPTPNPTSSPATAADHGAALSRLGVRLRGGSRRDRQVQRGQDLPAAATGGGERAGRVAGGSRRRRRGDRRE